MWPQDVWIGSGCTACTAMLPLQLAVVSRLPEQLFGGLAHAITFSHPALFTSRRWHVNPQSFEADIACVLSSWPRVIALTATCFTHHDAATHGQSLVSECVWQRVVGTVCLWKPGKWCHHWQSTRLRACGPLGLGGQHDMWLPHCAS